VCILTALLGPGGLYRVWKHGCLLRWLTERCLHMHDTTPPSEAVKRRAPEPKAELVPSAESLNKADAGLASQRGSRCHAATLCDESRPAAGERPANTHASKPSAGVDVFRDFQTLSRLALNSRRPELFRNALLITWVTNKNNNPQTSLYLSLPLQGQQGGEPRFQPLAEPNNKSKI